MKKKKRFSLYDYLQNQYIEFCITVAALFAIFVKIAFFIISYLLNNSPFPFNALSSLAFVVLQITMVIVLIIMVIQRIRAHTFLNTCLLYRVIKAMPLTYKAALLLITPFLIMLMLTLMNIAGININFYISYGIILSILLYIINSLGLIDQLARIKQKALNIAQDGNEESVSTDGMYLDTKEITTQLSHIDEGLKNALDESLKAERFKTDLITNVSHDIKTPLTSIVNYVDLMKKLDIKDETFTSYLEVLVRNSNRLKVLTNDLVEASKTGTGNVEVNIEKLELVELVAQAYGGFDSSFLEKNITFVFNHPQAEIFVMADGNHMWRVLENIFSNALKYTLEDTRVYGDICKDDEYVHFTLKNISFAPLNITSDELMEQFVRGERSRHTEGSGLGLYIAKNLMDLMGGKLQIRIDGDLFEINISMKHN